MTSTLVAFVDRANEQRGVVAPMGFLGDVVGAGDKKIPKRLEVVRGRQAVSPRQLMSDGVVTSSSPESLTWWKSVDQVDRWANAGGQGPGRRPGAASERGQATDKARRRHWPRIF